MQPNIQINYLAILIAVLVNFIISAIWYMPLFGRAWAKEMKIDMNGPKPPSSEMITGMAIMVIGSFLMAFVFSHNIAAWNPISWGQPASPMTSIQTASMAAIFTWIGFYLPQDLSRIAWEKHSFKLFLINTGYHLVSLLVAAIIIVKMS